MWRAYCTTNIDIAKREKWPSFGPHPEHADGMPLPRIGELVTSAAGMTLDVYSITYIHSQKVGTLSKFYDPDSNEPVPTSLVKIELHMPRHTSEDFVQWTERMERLGFKEF
jgi:hypothetical protein